MIPKSFQKISKLALVGAAVIASTALLAKSILTKEQVCKAYKDQYVSYKHVGSEIFYVTSNCTRQLLPKEKVQSALADKARKVFAVEEQTIALIPREAPKQVSAIDVIREYEGRCVSALDGKVWKVTARGKRLIPDFATTNALCPKVHSISDAKLSLLGDEKDPYPSVHDNVVKAKKTKTAPVRLTAAEVCAQMKVGHLYSHGNEYYQLGKQGKVCYLQKLTAEQMSDLMTKLKITPVPLTQSQYISLNKSKIIESKG